MFSLNILPLVFLLTTSTLIWAAPYPIIHATALNCRSTPNTSGKIIKTYSASADLKVSCQSRGENINGNDLWDKTQDNCFVADFYVKTGSSKAVAPLCSSSDSTKGDSSKPSTSSSASSSSKVPGSREDDYKFKGDCGGVDSYLYFKCQCTSFVAQRINERLGIKFNNHYRGSHWGNANTWDEAARKTGVKIDQTPRPGAIAQRNKDKGHVAWVSEVTKDGMVVVEEYNFRNPEAYGVRMVPKSEFDNYIHLK